MSIKWQFEKNAEKVNLSFREYNNLIKKYGFFAVSNAYNYVEERGFRSLDVSHFIDIIHDNYKDRLSQLREKGLNE